MAFEDIFQVVDSATAEDGTVVEILEMTDLKGYWDTYAAERLYFANRAGMRAKMVRIRLQDTNVRLEPGALYYMKGDLELKTGTRGGIMKGLLRKTIAGETFFVNEIHGTGEVYLEPTFGHCILHHIEQEEQAVIVDKGYFLAGTSGLDIGTAKQKKTSAALFGGKGFFQTRVTGRGVAVIFSPVPLDEIQKVSLGGDKLFVDGSFAFMRSLSVDFRVEKSNKSWLGTSVAGEGFLSTFSGRGHVWLAPTQSVYSRLVTIPGGPKVTGGGMSGGGNDGDFGYDEGEDDD
ncbi:MAG TPA: AIM24 family protein [Desulfomicrobiaceae bacterium]|nr:AIM24 family protein [Desulfomicrobiaceae bacterium]